MHELVEKEIFNLILVFIQNSSAVACMSVSMDEDEERSEPEPQPQLDQGRPKRVCKQPERFQPDMTGLTDDYIDSDYDSKDSGNDDAPLIPEDGSFSVLS